MGRHPFSKNDTIIKVEVEYRFKCEHCGAMIEYFEGHHNTVIQKSNDPQMDLF